MSQKMTKQQLKKMLEDGRARKEELLKLKAENTAWDDSLQEELDNLVITLVDLEDEVNEAPKPEVNEAPKPEVKKAKKAAYEPKGLAKKMIHVRIVYGHRFDSNTGKEISVPSIQRFTFGEWQNFAKHHSSLGYRILEVIYDPYGIAKVDE